MRMRIRTGESFTIILESCIFQTKHLHVHMRNVEDPVEIVQDSFLNLYLSLTKCPRFRRIVQDSFGTPARPLLVYLLLIQSY